MDSLYLCLALIIFCASSAYGAGRRHYHHDYNVHHRDHHVMASEECEDTIPDNLCDLNDYECMQNYLAAHSHCKCTSGHIADSTVFSPVALPMPSANTTLFARQTEVFGFRSAKVVAFYQNSSSSNLVIAFQMRNIKKLYRPATLMIQRRAQEPVLVEDNITTRIGQATFTAIIPCMPSLDLARATIYAHIDSCDIEVHGPRIGHHADPAFKKAMKYIMQNLDVAGRESISVVAHRFMNHFIQKKLCDFGVHY